MGHNNTYFKFSQFSNNDENHISNIFIYTDVALNRVEILIIIMYNAEAAKENNTTYIFSKTTIFKIKTPFSTNKHSNKSARLIVIALFIFFVQYNISLGGRSAEEAVARRSAATLGAAC